MLKLKLASGQFHCIKMCDNCKSIHSCTIIHKYLMWLTYLSREKPKRHHESHAQRMLTFSLSNRLCGSPLLKALMVQCTEPPISGMALEFSLTLLTMTERLVSLFSIVFHERVTQTFHECVERGLERRHRSVQHISAETHCYSHEAIFSFLNSEKVLADHVVPFINAYATS